MPVGGLVGIGNWENTLEAKMGMVLFGLRSSTIFSLLSNICSRACQVMDVWLPVGMSTSVSQNLGGGSVNLLALEAVKGEGINVRGFKRCCGCKVLVVIKPPKPQREF